MQPNEKAAGEHGGPLGDWRRKRPSSCCVRKGARVGAVDRDLVRRDRLPTGVPFAMSSFGVVARRKPTPLSTYHTSMPAAVVALNGIGRVALVLWNVHELFLFLGQYE